MKYVWMAVCGSLTTLFIMSAVIRAVDSNFSTGIGRSGTTGLNISADTPGPIKYHLEFKPFGGSRQISASSYDDSSKNFSATVNVKCLDGGECSKDETYVRGIYIAGTTGGYAAAKKFTLFCGSIQVVAEEKTEAWDDTFYTKVAEDFLTNGPSSGNCPTPTITPSAATVTPSPATEPTRTAKANLKTSPTPTPTDTPGDKDTEETPTPTPKEDVDDNTAGYAEYAPSLIAGLVLLGVIGYVLYRKNAKFNSFIHTLGSRSKKKDS